MESCKSLVIANKVLKELINNETLEKCWYHSFYSGGVDPNGFCGYIVYGQRAQSSIKITFYGTNKTPDTPVRIYILIDKKSKVRDRQLSIEDAIRFIEAKVAKFMLKGKDA